MNSNNYHNTNNNNKSYIFNNQIILNILGYCGPSDLFNTQVVSKVWYKLSRSNNVWEHALRNRIGDYTPIGTTVDDQVLEYDYYLKLGKMLFPQDAYHSYSHKLIFNLYPLLCPSNDQNLKNIDNAYGNDIQQKIKNQVEENYKFYRKSLDNLFKFMKYKPILDQDTNIISIIKDSSDFSRSSLSLNQGSLDILLHKHQLAFLIPRNPEESNHLTKIILIDFIGNEYGTQNNSSESKICISETKVERTFLDFDNRIDKHNHHQDKQELIHYWHRYHDGYVAEMGNSDPVGDIRGQDYYVSKMKLDKFAEFLDGAPLFGKSNQELYELLSLSTNHPKQMNNFEFSNTLDHCLVHHLQDIQFYFEYSEKNPEQIEFILFNFEIKSMMVKELIDRSDDNDIQQHEQQLFKAINNMTFYKYNCKFAQNNSSSLMNFYFSTQFSIPLSGNETVYFNIYFTLQDQNPNPDLINNNNNSIHHTNQHQYFISQIDFIIFDNQTEISLKRDIEFKSMYNKKPENGHLPKKNESFINGIQESFKINFPNLNFNIIDILKLLNLDKHIELKYNENSCLEIKNNINYNNEMTKDAKSFLKDYNLNTLLEKQLV
ncbi:hypothetical protein CYY_003063 [Polysphondylium violaceum]|uniref:F-box domain-containing protein n=1 Tax=Polysphondylium violaceum TaxID=133409 RepID=A0A8J4PXR5_9MYCE|nr:hypothetical protein CYY_003063 [Polysphondylium violaceum]